MNEPIWIPIEIIPAINQLQIRLYGGSHGLRDRALLEMACDRPVNLFAYEHPSIEDLAAAYAFGIVKAHAFMDGNKRTALVVTLSFLGLNNYWFRREPQEEIRMVKGLASGAVSETEFAAWIGSGIRPLT